LLLEGFRRNRGLSPGDKGYQYPELDKNSREYASHFKRKWSFRIFVYLALHKICPIVYDYLSSFFINLEFIVCLNIFFWRDLIPGVDLYFGIGLTALYCYLLWRSIYK
jgi:hypothetical protein